MSNFDYLNQDEPQKPSARRAKTASSPEMIWNVLSVALVFVTMCVMGYVMSVFINPYSPLNPFPPPTLPPILTTATATWTPRPLGSTWTPTPSVVPSETPTRRPTITPFPSQTPFSFVTETYTPAPTRTATSTYTPKPSYGFGANQIAVDSEIVYADLGCAWFGVAGKVEDRQGSPVIGMVIRLTGFVGNQTVNLTTVSNVAPAYGQGGFEFKLGDAPISSKDTLYIQLFDQGGIPLSDRLSVTTYNDCAKNLVIVTFKQK